MTSSVLVMDGGMGHQLRREGVEVTGAIGTIQRFLGVALANSENPQLVKKAHSAFIDAGARVIITNNYSCVPACVGGNVVDHIQAAGKVAREAVAGTNVMVAGSLPPLHASYRFDQVATEQEMARDYATIAKAIAPFADVLVCETMSKACEAAAAYHAALATGKPVWVSWALSERADGTLLSGETVEEAVEALGAEALVAAAEDSAEGGLQACLFNCSPIEAVDVALPRLRAALPVQIRIGAYANGFKTVHSAGADAAESDEACTECTNEAEGKDTAKGAESPLKKFRRAASTEYRIDLTPKNYAQAAKHWANDCGATIIGGCCGIFPEHIAALAETFASPCSCDTGDQC